MSLSNFDLNYLAENKPSMCIPRVFENISERQVREVFEQLDLGQLDRIDIIERRSEKGEKYKRVFIHFSRWYWNDDAINARRRLVEGKDIKVVYNMPWFWKISANRWTGNNQQRESNAIHEDIRRNVRHNGPRIEFDDLNEDRYNEVRDDRRQSEARNDRRQSEARNDRKQSEVRNDRRPSNEVRRDDRYNEVRRDNRYNEVRDEVRPQIIKEEPKQSAAEIAQLEVINSTKKRKIILKKKEPQTEVQAKSVKVEESIKDA